MRAYNAIMGGYFCSGFNDYYYYGYYDYYNDYYGLQTELWFIILFFTISFKNNNKIILIYIKMGEALNIYPNLRNQTKFRLKIINEIKDCLIIDIRERSNE